MTFSFRRVFALCVVSLGALAQAQTPPPAPGAPPAAAGGATIGPKRASCEVAKRNAQFEIYFEKVDIEKLVQIVDGLLAARREELADGVRFRNM
jgi:hypothetical protein